jgi:hypothetical protein
MYAEQLGEDALARQRRESAPKCKSCGAPIRWAITRSGRRMPLDYDESPTGNVLLFGDESCRVIGADEQFTPSDATRHTSHFATCPQGAAHRRKQLAIVEPTE